jgi:hypothetical protein
MKRMTLLLACTLALVAVPNLFAEEPSCPVAAPILPLANGSCATSASKALQPLPAVDLPDLAEITGIAGSLPAGVCNRPCSTCLEADSKCNWDCRCRGLCAYSFQCDTANPCSSVCICIDC